MTSDTFYIEEIYTVSTLKNTSEYYFADFFPDEKAKEILINEGLNEKDAEYVVDWIGGVPWMLERVLSKEDVKEAVNTLYENEKARLYDFLLNCDEEESAKKVLMELLSGKFKPTKENIKIVKKLVEAEILFYDPLKTEVKFQIKLDERATRELLGV